MVESKIPEDMNHDDVYRMPYTMRRQGEDGMNTVVTIPPIVIAKEARKRNLTPEEFVKQYKAVATFNGFPGVLYQFKKIDKPETGIEPMPEPTVDPEGNGDLSPEPTD